jgi:hypothetical protein
MEVEKILERLDSLISMGNGVLASCEFRPGRIGLYADAGRFSRWRTSSLSFLNTFPLEYIYSREFEACCKDVDSDDVKQGLGILVAAKDDIKGGYLQKMETLVSASVFSDFLEMAEHLLDNGYKHPAASLTGAVLEDGLRRICSNKNIPVKSDDGIHSLNNKLVQNRIYNPLQQKQIQVWNDIRNNADHGNFDQYEQDDVEDMLKGVRKFLTDYLK